MIRGFLLSLVVICAGLPVRAQSADPRVIIDLDVIDRIDRPTVDLQRRSLPLPAGLSDDPPSPEPAPPAASLPPEQPPRPAEDEPVALQPAPVTAEPALRDAPPATDQDSAEIPPPVAALPTPPPVNIPPPPPEAATTPPPAPVIERPAQIIAPPDPPPPDPPPAEPQAAAPVERASLGNRTAPQPIPMQGLVLAFPAGESDITAEAERDLQTAIAWLDANPSGRLQITAYADGGNNRSRARQLSFQRGLAVRSWLLQRGISDARLDVAARGDAAEAGPLDRVDLGFRN